MSNRFKVNMTNDGVSRFIVVIAIVVLGFLGTAAMVELNPVEEPENSENQSTDLARNAARYGMLAALSVLENPNIDNLALFQSWINNAINSPTVLVSGDITKGGAVSYSTELLAFDPIAFNVTLKSVGGDGDSSLATMVSVYHLDGLAYDNSEEIDLEEQHSGDEIDRPVEEANAVEVEEFNDNSLPRSKLVQTEINITSSLISQLL